MPMYTYFCKECKVKKVKIASIRERDYQSCDECESVLSRKIDSPGRVWSPTRNGGTS